MSLDSTSEESDAETMDVCSNVDEGLILSFLGRDACRMARLTSVDLSDSLGVSAASISACISALAQCSGMVSVALPTDLSSSACLSGLKQLRGLRRLVTHSTPDGAASRALAALVGLTDLDWTFPQPPYRNAYLEPFALPALPALQSLWVLPQGRRLTFPTQLTSLTKLCVHYDTLNDGDLMQLARLPALESLEVSLLQLSDASNVRPLPLTVASLKVQSGMEGAHRFEAWFGQRLTELHFDGAADDDVIAVCTGAPGLRRLRLFRGYYTPAGLIHASLLSLEELIIYEPRGLTDGDFAALVNASGESMCKSLRELQLGGCFDLTPAISTSLASLVALRKFRIFNCSNFDGYGGFQPLGDWAMHDQSLHFGIDRTFTR